MMTRSIKTAVVSVMSLALVSLLPACSKTDAPAAGTVVAQIKEQTKEQMIDLGRQHKTAAELYQALREQAKGGQRLVWNSLPDWSGVYTRTPVPGFAFDKDQPPGGLPTAKLTQEFHAKMVKRIEDAKKGIEWDPSSTCAPPGHPRWLTEPFRSEEHTSE